MDVSQETESQTNYRLRRVASRVRLEVLEREWWFEEFPLDGLQRCARDDAIALVQDRKCWSQLVPVRGDDRPGERLRVWCCHFPADLDNSGFIGWLATRIKRETGSGIFVVCGQNRGDGGIYDYAGCPAAVADAVIAEVRSVIRGDETLEAGPTECESLDGRVFRVVSTADKGEVAEGTVLAFSQEQTLVTAQYKGGSVRFGSLVGLRQGSELRFRYAQVNRSGCIDGGRSRCVVGKLPDGRYRIEESFQWDSREGSGINVFEEIRT